MLEIMPGKYPAREPMAKTLHAELKTYGKPCTWPRTVANYRRGRYEFVIGRAIIDTLLPQRAGADGRAVADCRRGDSGTRRRHRRRRSIRAAQSSRPADQSVTNLF